MLRIRMTSCFAGAALLTVLGNYGFAQSPAPSAGDTKSGGPLPTFDIADVHASPHSNTPFMRGGDLRGSQYIVRQASMVDLIANAYGVENDNVIGGPAWLDTYRFEIVAKAPRTTSPEDVKRMLGALLADRFKLVVHPDSKPLPAFVLSMGKGAPKLKAADPAAASECGPQNPQPATPAGAVPYNYVSCHNMTMDAFAQSIHQMANGYLTKPVVNSTGLKGAWDFDIKWTSRGALQKAGDDGISVFDAVDKQLGLKLESKTAPLPVVTVDSVNDKPTPNAPGIDKELPPPPPAAFDVAVIKPSPPDAKLSLQIKGGQVTITGATMQFLITWAWNLNPNDKEALVGAPKSLDQDHYDILGKAAPDPSAKGGTPQIDFDALQEMVRTLITDRFEMKSHMGEHLADAYTLVAAGPKVKKGDPQMRTGCKEGPGADGKDPRIANPILGRLLTCQNMTMAEFGDELRTQVNGYMFYPVVDATGLEGGYDFTLSFSAIQQLNAPPPPASTNGNAPNSASVSEPSGAVSLFDAINKQLGLKLEKQRRPEPALVIDHIDEKPTEN